MAKATEINCPKCHAKVLMRFAGKDGIQCKRCYYWISRDIMLKLVSEQEGEPLAVQPEPEEEESFVICTKCHHKTFYSKIMDGGVMCKKCYNWIIVEETPEVPPVIEEAVMHKHSPSHARTAVEKHTHHEAPESSALYKEHKPEFAISGGNYIVGKSLEEIPVKAEKIAIVGKDILPVEETRPVIPTTKPSTDEESLDWFRHKPTSSHKTTDEEVKPADVKEKKEAKDSWYISQEKPVADKTPEPVEEEEEDEQAQEEQTSDKKKSKKYKPRRKDLTHSEGGKRKIKAKSPGKESRVFKKATKKLVTRRKHEKEAEPESPVKETPVEVTEDAPVIVTPPPATKKEPKVKTEAAVEKSIELKEKTEEALAPPPPAAKEPAIAMPVKEEPIIIPAEPALAMPAPTAKKEDVGVDTVEIPIPIGKMEVKSKDLSDDFETRILKEPPLELPPPPKKIAEPIVTPEKAIPIKPVEKAHPVSEKPELDEAFIAAYLPKNLSSDVVPLSQEILPQVPEDEIIALMPEMDMADEDILDFLVEPPDFEIPGMDAAQSAESSEGIKASTPDSSLTDSTIMQIQQPEIVVRQIPASMRPKMTSMLGKPSKREDLDLPQKDDYSTTKLPKKTPEEIIAAVESGYFPTKPHQAPPKPVVTHHKPAEQAYSLPDIAEAGKKSPGHPQHETGTAKPSVAPVVSVRMKTPEVKKPVLPGPAPAYKTASHPPAKPSAVHQNIPSRPSVPTVPSRPPISGPVSVKPAVSGSPPITPIKRDTADRSKTPPPTAAQGKPKTAGTPDSSILARKIIAPKKIDISGVFKKKQ